MIDKRAARGFVAAEHYESYRPSYPPEAIAFVRRTVPIGQRSTVVDVGAGTGLMTRLLRPVGRLIAVEPLPTMREVLRERVPEAEVMEGTAEEIPLPSAVADAIVVAQAFHWFANPQAMGEIARVVKPDGALALVWNVKNPADPFMAGLDAVLAPYRLNSPGFDSTPWRELFDGDDAPMHLESHETFFSAESITLSHLKGRMLSISYVNLLDDETRSEVIDQVQELVAAGGNAGDDTPVVIRHKTEVFIARHG